MLIVGGSFIPAPTKSLPSPVLFNQGMRGMDLHFMQSYLIPGW